MNCGFWDEDRFCETPADRLYIVGYRCPSHTPAVIAGRTEVIPDPALNIEAGYARSGWQWSFNRNDNPSATDRRRASRFR